MHAHLLLVRKYRENKLSFQGMKMKIITVMTVLLLISNASHSKEITENEYITLKMEIAIGNDLRSKQKELISKLKEKIKNLEEQNRFYKNLSQKMWQKEHH